MTKRKTLYTFKDVLASMLMLALLTWLTVCLPFVNQSQKAAKVKTEQSSKEDKSNNGNPLSNTNEERSESGTSLLQEYLHEVSHLEHHFITLTTFFKGHPSDIYIAYHPELVIPPPEA
jgi:hypothetical protein